MTKTDHLICTVMTYAMIVLAALAVQAELYGWATLNALCAIRAMLWQDSR